eukprot:6174665-Pleurochrysis_carterae.AAC.1
MLQFHSPLAVAHFRKAKVTQLDPAVAAQATRNRASEGEDQLLSSVRSIKVVATRLLSSSVSNAVEGPNEEKTPLPIASAISPSSEHSSATQARRRERKAACAEGGRAKGRRARGSVRMAACACQ